MQNDKQTIENFIKYWLNFYNEVNDMKGVSSLSFDKLENSLLELKILISKNNSVPPEVASVFIDMYSSLESLSGYYVDSQPILECADFLAVLARDACSVE